MKSLLLVGGGPDLWQLAEQFRGAGFAVTRPPKGRPPERAGPEVSADLLPFRLALIKAVDLRELRELLPSAEELAASWLFLCGGTSAADSELTTAAYQAGALAVLPAGSSVELVVQAVERAVDSHRSKSDESARQRSRRRTFQAGETLPLRVEESLRIIEGVVAQLVWHEDGAAGLLGLWGPGHLLTGHPEDACCLTLRAHTRVVAEVGKLDVNGENLEKLLLRIRCLEAWSSAQSRQNVEQRLLGVLSLLAEQYGEGAEEGTRISVRLTHAQLAETIGATRATVTRLLGVLRRRGLVWTVSSSQGERFCLPLWPGAGARGTDEGTRQPWGHGVLGASIRWVPGSADK